MQFDLCTYNIRGLNSKQAFVKDFIGFHKLSFVVLLETHVQESNAPSISRFIGPNFLWIFNYDHCSNGRIWIGYNPTFWKVQPIASSAQHSSCAITLLSSGSSFMASFIYGFNSAIERRTLWDDLTTFKAQSCSNLPWCLSGDFNVCYGPHESSAGSHWTTSMLEFKDFMCSAELTDLRTSGQTFTWWDCNLSSPVFKRLDRCSVNGEWLLHYPYAHASVLQRGISDHCPVALSLGIQSARIPKPFQFFNHLLKHPDFLNTVQQAWNLDVSGTPWFILTSKLKKVKAGLKHLNSINGNVHFNVSSARNALLSFQTSMSFPPSHDELIIEKDLIDSFNLRLQEEEAFYKQKSRINWLKCGDSNNQFFFRACKSRWNCNKIL